MGMVKSHHAANFNSIAETELEKVEALVKEEPNSKWPLLTSVFLLMELQKNADIVLSKLQHLISVDPQRSNYYRHLITQIKK